MADLNRSLRVFLCHASNDKPSVQELYYRLVSDGIDAWLDKEKLIPGQDWQVEIAQAVRNSDIVLVCLSSHSVTKEGFVQKEIKFALDVADEKPEGTIFIIPARLEECNVPSRLGKFHWVDLFDRDGYEWLFKALQIRSENIGIKIGRKKNLKGNLEKTDANPKYTKNLWGTFGIILGSMSIGTLLISIIIFLNYGPQVESSIIFSIVSAISMALSMIIGVILMFTNLKKQGIITLGLMLITAMIFVIALSNGLADP